MICHPYFLDEDFIMMKNIDPMDFPKRYNGDAQALILKASSGLVETLPGKRITTKNGDIGLPEDVFKNALELLSLWKREAPGLDMQMLKRPQDPGTESSSDGKRKKFFQPSKKGIAMSPKNRGKSRGKDPSKNRSAIEGYAWGPETTSARIMSVVSGWRRLHKLDKADKAKRVAKHKKTKVAKRLKNQVN